MSPALHASALTLLVAAAPSAAHAATWEIDPSHTYVGFSVRHLGLSTVRGQFGKVSGRIVFDEKDLAHSTADVTIDAASIDTHEPKRDDHLRSADFFDVKTYPTLSFQARSFRRVGKGRWKVTGRLTIRGIAREVVLDASAPTPEAKDPWGGTRAGVSLSGRINRQDFGLTWNKALDNGGVVVGNEVTLQLDVELLKRPDAATPPAPAR